MKILWQELKKIARQLRGSENIFGYRSTVANQLYLFYCFGGNIYFTDQIHKQVKHFWYGLVSCQILYSYLIGFEYLWYERKNDLTLIIHVVNCVGMINSATLGSTLIVYLLRDRIEAMINRVDSILTRDLTSGFKHEKILADRKTYFAWYLIPSIICYSGYSFLCIPDAVLFFEEEKLSNGIYYTYPPPPLVQKYSNIWLFFIATGITSVVFAFTLLQTWSVFGLLINWNIICCTQLSSIKNSLHAGTCDLSIYTDEEVKLMGKWNGIFDHLLKHCIREFQETTRLINYLKALFETVGTILVINGFWIGMTVLYICFTDDLPLLLKVKFLMGYMATVILVFLFYWMGQNLNNSVSEVSLAVYSTPWYRSVKIRKLVYIFLCQTQSVKDFAVLKVYGLLLNNFSLYLHGQMSKTNILRQLTTK